MESKESVILIIDTCGAEGSVVVADAGASAAVLGSARLPGRSASERLVATIRDLSARTGVGLQSLKAIVVAHGPGSFTGVRVGVSAAKGLCEALEIPIVAISRLAVLAHLAGAAAGGQVCAVLDAGRGEYYVGFYADGVCLREALLTREELAAELDGSVESLVVTHPGVSVVVCEPAVAESLAMFSPRRVAEPTVEDALPLAMQRLQAGEYDDSATLDANYLRRTDAEIFAKPSPGSTTNPASGNASTMKKPRAELRPAYDRDLDAVFALERATEHAPHWPAAAYQAILDGGTHGLPERCLIVAEVDSALVGFAVGLLHPAPERVAELESVVVAESARRVGTGRALCVAIIEWAQACGAVEVMLEVRARSHGAVALYTGLGFERTGFRSGYYSDTVDDAWLMRKELGPVIAL